MPTLIIITVNAGKTISDAHQMATSDMSTFRANGVSVHSSTMVFPSGDSSTTQQASSDGQNVFVGYKGDEYEYQESIPLGNVRRKAAFDDSSMETNMRL